MSAQHDVVPAADEVMDLAGDSAEAMYDLLAAHGWGDGLPAIPPTAERVDRILERYPGSADEVLAVLPPRMGLATVRIAAVNSVMAGCPPEVFPAVCAAVRALGQPQFNLRGVQATTHSVAIMLIVHGQLAVSGGFNAGLGALGPGNRANATTGRALRLILLHCGGGQPGDGDASTQGAPAKYTFCFAENTDGSPWPSYPASLGLGGASAVTVAGVEGPHNAHDMWSAEAHLVFDKVASVMTTLGSNNAAVANTEFFVLLCPEHAQLAAQAGWTRRDAQLYLHHRARLPVRLRNAHFGPNGPMRTRWAKTLPDDDLIPMTLDPDDIHVMVAGGAGKHSCVIPSWGSMSRSVTVPVE
jgi:hypothetical protein